MRINFVVLVRTRCQQVFNGHQRQFVKLFGACTPLWLLAINQINCTRIQQLFATIFYVGIKQMRIIITSIKEEYYNILVFVPSKVMLITNRSACSLMSMRELVNKFITGSSHAQYRIEARTCSINRMLSLLNLEYCSRAYRLLLSWIAALTIVFLSHRWHHRSLANQIPEIIPLSLRSASHSSLNYRIIINVLEKAYYYSYYHRRTNYSVIASLIPL